MSWREVVRWIRLTPISPRQLRVHQGVFLAKLKIHWISWRVSYLVCQFFGLHEAAGEHKFHLWWCNDDLQCPSGSLMVWSTPLVKCLQTWDFRPIFNLMDKKLLQEDINYLVDWSFNIINFSCITLSRRGW